MILDFNYVYIAYINFYNVSIRNFISDSKRN